MHRAHEAEMREQAAHAGPLLAPLDVSAAIREFVGSGCYISGVGSIDNVPGSLIFSVEVRKCAAFCSTKRSVFIACSVDMICGVFVLWKLWW